MTAKILSIAGGIGSGKAELARGLSERTGWPWYGFGIYVRAVARTRGLSEERKALQELGASLIQEYGWDGFCLAILREAGWSIGKSMVIEGIRHAEALEALKRVASPSEVILVYVETAPLTRSERRPADADMMEELQAHSTEIQVETVLRLAASLVIDGGRDLRELVDTVESWLNLLGLD